jgi:hypothetical protein
MLWVAGIDYQEGKHPQKHFHCTHSTARHSESDMPMMLSLLGVEVAMGLTPPLLK